MSHDEGDANRELVALATPIALTQLAALLSLATTVIAGRGRD